MDLMTILIIGGGAGLILLGIGIVVSLTSERTLVEERLGRYVEDEQYVVQVPGSQQQSAPLTDWLNKRMEKSTFGERIARELARADLKFKPGEYVGVIVIAIIAMGFFGYFVGGKSIIVALIGCVVGGFLPRWYVRREQGRRLIRFNDQLADMLNLMVNGLRAGYSTIQAMEAVSKELPSPISDEFRRVVQEMQLGIAIEKALDNLLRRIPSDDLDLVITAINVQREVGGNLAEILDTISFTIRERVRIKGEIRVLTTQVMYSGKFLSILPLFVIAALYFLNRSYIMQFFSKENFPCGYIALGVAGIMIALGYFVMQKLGEIEV